MDRRARKALLIALTLGMAGAAQAQDYVRADCRAMLESSAPRFETALHQRWYRRFWTGDCDHLPMCFPGAPNWNDIVGKLLVRGGPSEQAALLPKACRLGQTIGLEWARDKKVRRIDTGDLHVFKKQLEASGDALRGVEKVEASVRAKLTR
ncbi:MAG: hypothetical protein J7494_12965 [Sphingobium sp.]|nr:hypothetical protein [Sphingobium sp.]